MRIPLLLALAAALSPRVAAAQFPGELAGSVRDAATSAPLAGATVELEGTGLSARSDASGGFRLRGLEPGGYRVRVRLAGYAARALGAEVHNGATAHLDLLLQPLVVALAPLRATAVAGEAGAASLDRAQITASGARSVADLVERLPGVMVQSSGPNSPRTVSIRGSAADQVLVLVDGVPLNDLVSGAADLSAIPAASVARVSVLSGARTARYGPRAQAGVVLIETRSDEARTEAELSTGTLGERGFRAETGAGRGWGWSVGGGRRRVGGGFTYPRDVNDPTPVRRANDDLGEWHGFAGSSGSLAGGELRLRAGAEGLERGLPGTGHTPSPEAREALRRAHGSAAWRAGGARGGVSLLLSGSAQRVVFADPAPPFGLAYHDTTRVAGGALQLEGERLLGEHALLRSAGGGVAAGVQRVEAGALSDAAPRTRTDLGFFGRTAGGAAVAGRTLEWTADGRMDRDGVGGGWYLSRALGLAGEAGGVRLALANRSSFSPPSLGDQFFREGVGVVPNPDLRAERVPSEWELSAGGVRRARGAELSLSAAAWTGSVRGMIVWLPDFTFRWSPRNLDVARRGLDLRGEAGLPARHLRLSGAWSYARITYARDEAAGIQLAYRPRYSGVLTAGWSPRGWRAELGTRFTGTRYPAAAPVNALPGFWSARARLARRWSLGGWNAEAALDADRLFDERSSLIAGYPEPGRRVRLDLRLARASSSPIQ